MEKLLNVSETWSVQTQNRHLNTLSLHLLMQILQIRYYCLGLLLKLHEKIDEIIDTQKLYFFLFPAHLPQLIV